MSRMRRMMAGLVVAAGMLGAVSVQADGERVPFKGEGGGEITGQHVLGPNQVLLITESTGTATELGRFRRAEYLLLDPATGAFNGFIRFTAANRDQLVAFVTGQFISASDAVGTYSVIGGTGRFRHACGQATFSASMTGPTSFTFEFEGDLQR